VLPAKARLTRRSPVLALRALALVLAAAALLVAGCGEGEEESAPSDPDAGGDTSLAITLDPDGPEGPDESLSAQASCGAEDAVCEAVNALKASDFDPTSPDQACTEIFGGPDIATLEGTIGGEDVDAELTRANGCEIERFDRAIPLLQALFEGYVPGAAIEGPVAG